jgi:FMN phosphatase YigB (HAD superfamily)
VDGERTRAAKNLARMKDIYKSMKNCLDNWLEYDPKAELCKLPSPMFEEAEALAPSVAAKLHSMDIKDLRRAMRENEKQMEGLFRQYEGRYTTKANKSIYALIVIGLRAELETILANLKFEATEKANLNVRKAIEKVLAIATDGNQSIVPTLQKFVGQIEHHFLEAVKIEHLWYVRKEQQRLEQIAIRDRMREEAAARKAIEEAQKRIAEEETKYQNEIARLQEALAAASPEKEAEIRARLQEVQGQMAEVAVKKEEIAALAKGKAGTVYVVSNLGSFGENVFKIGMTRRIDPQERIDELGTASVPFEFDVHSFIFSPDAVALEGALHERMWPNRLNKVNPHKEFFVTSVDELEKLVQEIAPAAEFNRTMAAEDFRASQENIQLGEVQASTDGGDDDADEEDMV